MSKRYVNHRSENIQRNNQTNGVQVIKLWHNDQLLTHLTQIKFPSGNRVDKKTVKSETNDITPQKSEVDSPIPKKPEIPGVVPKQTEASKILNPEISRSDITDPKPSDYDLLSSIPNKIRSLPVPQHQTITIRPNQRIQINLITGIANNPGVNPSNLNKRGFFDRVGKSVINETSKLVSHIDIVVPPYHGQLTYIGPIGVYEYTPKPRSLEQDSFIFSFGESSALVLINIISIPPPEPGPNFIYCNPQTKSVWQKNGDSESLIFTSQFPGDIDSIATNRDDSLIYFCDPVSGDKIYAFDYISQIQFKVCDLSNHRTSELFAKYPGIMLANGATYHRGILYVLAFSDISPVIGFWKIAVGSYQFGSSSQEVLSVSFTEFSDQIARHSGDITFDPVSGTLLIIWENQKDRFISQIDPLSGHVIRDFTLPKTCDSPKYICMSQNGLPLVLTEDGSSGAVLNLTKSGRFDQDGWFDSPGFQILKNSNVTKISEWISQPVRLTR